MLGLEAITLGLDETLTLGLGDELVLCPGEALALREAEMLAIALFTELPHPATMHPAIRIAAESRRPLVNRRMLILPGFYSSNRRLAALKHEGRHWYWAHPAWLEWPPWPVLYSIAGGSAWLTHRKPRWQVALSTVSPWRAAGR
jgi:hypothetical protein